jgi:hypothetical protein
MDEITKNLYSYIEIDDYSGFVRYISSVIIKNNIKIDNCCFQYLVESNNLSIIQKLIDNDLIINLDFCFDIFFEHFVKNLKSKEQIVFDIYVKFDNKINTENIYHFNNSTTDLRIFDYLIKKYKFSFTFTHYKALAKLNNTDVCIKYTKNFNIEHLVLACEVHNLKLITYCLLDMKIKPNHECFDVLITNNTYLKLDVAKIIDMFVAYGFNLTYDDILLATKNRITLNDNIFTKKFTPTKSFFDLCDFDFQPEYNKEMYRNMLWIYRLCHIARTSNHYTMIKSELKQRGLKLDAFAFQILNRKKNESQAYQKLIDVYENIGEKEKKAKKEIIYKARTIIKNLANTQNLIKQEAKQEIKKEEQLRFLPKKDKNACYDNEPKNYKKIAKSNGKVIFMTDSDSDEN